MLNLSTKTDSDTTKCCSTHSCIHSADSTEVALFCFYAAAKFKPAGFEHSLSKQNFCFNTFSIRFL